MKTWSWETFRFGITGWRSAFFMLLWVVCNTGLFVLGYLEQKNDQSLARLNDPLGQSVAMSRGAGRPGVCQCLSSLQAPSTDLP